MFAKSFQSLFSVDTSGPDLDYGEDFLPANVQDLLDLLAASNQSPQIIVTHEGDSLSSEDSFDLSIEFEGTVEIFFNTYLVEISGSGTGIYEGTTGPIETVYGEPGAHEEMLAQITSSSFTVTVSDVLGNELANETVSLPEAVLLTNLELDPEVDPFPDLPDDPFELPAEPEDGEGVFSFGTLRFSSEDGLEGGFGSASITVGSISEGSEFSGWTQDLTVKTLFGDLNQDIVFGDAVPVYFAGTLTSPDGNSVLELAPVIVELNYVGLPQNGEGAVLSGSFDTPASVATLFVTDPSTGITTQEVIGGFVLDNNIWVSNLESAPSGLITVNEAPTFVCFGEGTGIATPEGEQPVEQLRAGAMVLTADGRAVAVRWIGRQSVVAPFAGPQGRPVRICAGALGAGVPRRDLIVTKNHALHIDGVLCHAGALVNGSTITELSSRDLPARATYYHIETEAHEILLAQGAEAESFIDNVDRQRFDNHGEFVARFGRDPGPLVPLDLPRAKGPRQVPAGIKARLAARAEALLGPQRQSA